MQPTPESEHPVVIQFIHDAHKISGHKRSTYELPNVALIAKATICQHLALSPVLRRRSVWIKRESFRDSKQLERVTASTVHGVVDTCTSWIKGNEIVNVPSCPGPGQQQCQVDVDVTYAMSFFSLLASICRASAPGPPKLNRTLPLDGCSVAGMRRIGRSMVVDEELV